MGQSQSAIEGNNAGKSQDDVQMLEGLDCNQAPIQIEES